MAPPAPASRPSIRAWPASTRTTPSPSCRLQGGTRNNSPQMATLAKRLSDDEMKAVADYIAGLK